MLIADFDFSTVLIADFDFSILDMQDRFIKKIIFIIPLVLDIVDIVPVNKRSADKFPVAAVTELIDPNRCILGHDKPPSNFDVVVDDPTKFRNLYNFGDDKPLTVVIIPFIAF